MLSGVPCVVSLAFFLDTGGVRMIVESFLHCSEKSVHGRVCERTGVCGAVDPTVRCAANFKSSCFGSWLQRSPIFCRAEMVERPSQNQKIKSNSSNETTNMYLTFLTNISAAAFDRVPCGCFSIDRMRGRSLTFCRVLIVHFPSVRCFSFGRVVFS